MIEFKVYVLADQSGKYATNALKFNSIEEAVEYAKDLYSRWTLVTDWAIIPTTECDGGMMLEDEIEDRAVERMRR
jgi:hypothetical protein